MTKPLTVPMAVLAIMAIGCSSATGPTESYLWGERAGDSAVTLVNAGMEPSKACQQSIQAAMMLGDEPVLPATSPPKNLNIADAQKGCLDTFHK